MENLIAKYVRQIAAKKKLKFHHTTGELVNKFEIAQLENVIKDLRRLVKNAKAA